MQSTGDSISVMRSSSDRTAGWSGQWLGVCGLFVILGFSWLPNSYTRMVSWPYALIWQVAFGLWMVWSLWMIRQFSLPLRRLGYGLDWIILLAVIGCGLSTLTAQFSAIAYWNFLLFLSYIIILYVVVNWLRHHPPLKNRLWQSIVISGTLTHLVSVCFWRPSLEMWSGDDFFSAIRNPFPLGHHNFVGGYCLLMLPLTVGLTYAQRSKWQHSQRQYRWHWIGYGAIALNLFALYISGSRGALMGAVTVGMVVFPLYCFHRRPQKLRHWLLIAIALLVAVGALLSNPRVRSLVAFNPSSTAAISIQQIGDGPAKDRLFMLQAGRQILKDYPLLGAGPGNLSRVYNRYRPIDAGGGLELVQQLHNTPAQILAELGIVGLASYGLLLMWVVKIGTSLHKKIKRKIKSSQDKILLYSISASWLGYAVSSLTDYQLENIGIASTLLLTIALFAVLADEHLGEPSPPVFPFRIRRLVSLALLLVFSLMIQSWARVDAALYLHHAAQKNANSFDYATADAQWMKAAELMPSDPTYAALSSEQLIDIEKNAANENNKLKMREAAIASLKIALKAAPNDPWFHQNLATLLLGEAPQQAQQHLHQTISLFPRSPHHTYYTLGRSYLNQNKQTEAIAAFTLESLVNPRFLSSSLWQTEPFLELLPAVLDKTLSTQQTILSRTASDSSQHTWLQRQMLFTQWWHRRSFTLPAEMDSISRAILTVEEDPHYATALLRQAVESDKLNKRKSAALLLLSWRFPEEDFPPFLHKFNLTPEEKRTLFENIHAYRNFREWLTSMASPVPERLRFGLSFAYRNAAANDIRQILFADDLTYLKIFEYLTLFSDPPREFSQLDKEIVKIAQQDLNITFSR